MMAISPSSYFSHFQTSNKYSWSLRRTISIPACVFCDVCVFRLRDISKRRQNFPSYRSKFLNWSIESGQCWRLLWLNQQHFTYISLLLIFLILYFLLINGIPCSSLRHFPLVSCVVLMNASFCIHSRTILRSTLK